MRSICSRRRRWPLLNAILLLSAATLMPVTTAAIDTFHYDRRRTSPPVLRDPPRRKRQDDVDDRAKEAELEGDWNDVIPFKITNECEDTIWPAILTQGGSGPSTGGFALGSGEDRLLWTGKDWAGRIWGRTNCTVKGDSASCKTGDCRGKLSCDLSGEIPVTLAEMTLVGGINRDQTFYDISLVDGYNLPMAVKYIQQKNATKLIPPNLTNLACIATPGWIWNTAPVGTLYSTPEYPIPWEVRVTNQNVRRWCPWDELAFPPQKPGDGVFPYPDDDVPRDDFSPCFSKCAKTRSPADCCTGKYHDAAKCKPSHYSRAAKAVCPDAYSFAYDDHTSTFTVPSGGGFEVIFCPRGRSTNILSTLGPPLAELAAVGRLGDETLALLRNETYIRNRVEEEAAAPQLPRSVWLTMTVALSSLLLLA